MNLKPAQITKKAYKQPFFFKKQYIFFSSATNYNVESTSQGAVEVTCMTSTWSHTFHPLGTSILLNTG